jgi:hypothetical protein
MVGSSSLMVIRKAAKCPKLEFARVVPKKNELFTLNTIVLLTPNWSPADVKFRKNLYHQQVDSEKGPE